MAVAQPLSPAPPPLLTYAQYLVEGEVNQDYDIIDGVRIVTNPTRRHQDRSGNIYEAFRHYQRTTGRGRAYQSPCDVLIQRDPLRIRQPDVLFISHARLAQNPSDDDPAPLHPAPELVVEVLSPSDTPGVLSGKIADFCAVDVRECWLVDAMAQTVEVLRLSPTGFQSATVYGPGQNLSSLAFPGLTLSVDAIFAAP